jgi:hypothetical protein
MTATNVLQHTIGPFNNNLSAAIENLRHAPRCLSRIFASGDDNGVTASNLHRSDYLICQADDFHKISAPQLTGHGTEDSRPARVSIAVDQHNSIRVEANVTAIGTACCLSAPNDNAPNHFALFDRTARTCLLHTDDNDVTQAGKPPL